MIKLDRNTIQLQPPPYACIFGVRVRFGGSVGQVDPPRSIPSNVNTVSWLCYTLPEHRKSRGPGFEEIEEKLPSNWVFSSSSSAELVGFPSLTSSKVRICLFCCLRPVARTDGVWIGCKPCAVLKCVGTIPFQHQTGQRMNVYLPLCHVFGFPPYHATVGAPNYPAPPHEHSMWRGWVRCAARGRGCGWEI